MAALRWLVLSISTIVTVFAIIHLLTLLHHGATFSVRTLTSTEFNWFAAMFVGLAGVMASALWMAEEHTNH
jgi:hypothetical protein